MFEYIIQTWWAIPLFIFLSRILDVSIGTMRLIFISKGFKYYAPILGFFEVLIWLLAVKKIMVEVANPLTYIAYGLGFSTGTYLGMLIEEKVMTSKSLVRVITRKYQPLIDHFSEDQYHYSIVDAQGSTGKAKIFFMIVNKKQVDEVLTIVKKIAPSAFYVVEDVRYARDNPDLLSKNSSLFARLGFHRKSK